MLNAIAGRLLEQDQRLLVVAEDESLLASLDRRLWTEDKKSFLAHGLEGGSADQRQPILLSTRSVAPNRARNIALVDGQWRSAALKYDRAFFFFTADLVGSAREAWKDLGDEAGIERHYWANENGRWVEKG